MGDERGTAVGEQQGGTVGAPGTAAPVTFRAVPSVALVAVGFFALCLSPIAFQGGAWFLLFLVPLAVAVWVVRRATVVDAGGLRVRGVIGSRTMPWPQVATLRLVDRGWVRAVPHEGGDLELTGVRVRDLGRVGEASGGRITAPSPDEAEAADEHARELEATRIRLARLREQQAGAEQVEAEQAGDEQHAPGAGEHGGAAADDASADPADHDHDPVSDTRKP